MFGIISLPVAYVLPQSPVNNNSSTLAIKTS